MDILYKVCCGLDVHAKTVVACLNQQGKKEVRTFSTMTGDLLQLSDWLMAHHCEIVAMESTGVYWKPVFNILESSLEVMLVNTRHIKMVPGRKTDVSDAEWISDCLRVGLLKPSFIPPLEIRELRELTRYRSTLVAEKARLANRIQKLAESGNIKLSQVASDALGDSGKAMLRALSQGESDVVKMSEFAQRALRNKKPQLQAALNGRLTRNQRWVLSDLLDRYEGLEAAIKRVEDQIAEEVKDNHDPFVGEAVSLLETIPGISKRTAQVIVAEIGVQMEQFPNAQHLSSWAGVSPGNNESAGKRKSGKTTKGSKYLREALVQAAWAASHTKNGYLSAQYHRLARRMSKKKALVAVAHTILVIVYQVLKKGEKYKELGGDYLDKRNQEQKSKRLIRQLEALGLTVKVEKKEAA
jgi:transposase